MKIAVEGCCHGELDKIYETLQCLEKKNNIKVDLLLICGDFQAVRNRDDLKTMAVPHKYQKLNTFYKYYSGEKVAPVLTIFIGGNHEASSYMQELPYGGWVAKNIYYMGYANVIQVGGLRIGGLSGIYKERDYHKGHFEYPPYTEETKRSVYHIRNIEVFRLKQLRRPIDIFLTHDWPKDIARYGNLDQLLRRKPFLREEVMNGSLGCPPATQLLHKLQPSYWFSAHLHVKYTAHVQHSEKKSTKFLSLDKCLPRRQFLQVLDFPDKGKTGGRVSISLDPEWLCVLQATNHLMHLGRSPYYMPGPHSSERSNFEVSEEDIRQVTELFGGDLTLPENFKITAPTLEERQNNKPPGPPVVVNRQTSLLCSMLDLTDPNATHLGISNHQALNLDPEQLEILDDSNISDDSPTDVSSGVNTSYINSSLDTSNSFCSPGGPKLSSSFSTVAPAPQVDDDDEEFKAILAQQRRHSQQMSASSPSNGKRSGQKNDATSDEEPKPSSPSLTTVDRPEDEFAVIMADNRSSEQAASNSDDTQKLEEDMAMCAADKSSSDLESTSQDSQDEVERPGYQRNGPQTVDCLAVSTDGSFSARPRPATKHPSPTSIEDLSPTVKKLKRRNVSMYSSSGTEDDPC